MGAFKAQWVRWMLSKSCFGQRRAGAFHHVDPRLLRVPGDLHARGIDAHPRRLGQFRPGPVA